jgi:hypothetical protein
MAVATLRGTVDSVVAKEDRPGRLRWRRVPNLEQPPEAGGDAQADDEEDRAQRRGAEGARA